MTKQDDANHWRNYRTRTLTALHASREAIDQQHASSGRPDPSWPVSKRLAEALHPAFVIWLSKEFGEYESAPAELFQAIARALSWMPLHMAELVHGPAGPTVMARAIQEAIRQEMEEAIAADERDPEGKDDVQLPAAGTA